MPNYTNSNLSTEMRGNILRRSLWILPILLATIWLMGRFYSMEIAQEQELLESLEYQSSLSRLEIARQRMDTVFSDLFFLNHVASYVWVDGVLSPHEQGYIENFFRSFIENKVYYDQIRIIDMFGQEFIHIEKRDGSSVIMPPHKGDKSSGEHCFNHFIKLERNQVYLSPLNPHLNYEEMEGSLRPLLHIATPIFAENNTKIGVLIINYLARDLLDTLYSSSAMGNIMLLNKDGFWLESSNQKIEKEIQTQENRTWNFFTLYPEEAKTIYSQKQGQVKSSDGLFTFATIGPLDSMALSQGACDYEWKIVSMIPASILEWREEAIKNRFRTLSGIVVLILSVAVFLFIVEYERRQKIHVHLKEKTLELERVNMALNAMVKKTERDAMIDPLTELWNRRYMIKRLNEEDARIQHTQGSASIAVIDLGNFKKINDTYGHARGDRALVQIAAILREGLRQTDYVARTGGDEFLIYFADLPLTKAKKIMERLYNRIMQHRFAGANSPIFADYGIAHCPSDADSLEETVKVADSRMYAFKVNRKGHTADTEK